MRQLNENVSPEVKRVCPVKKRSYQDIDFYDSEFKSFSYDLDSDVLDVKINLWNDILSSIQFSDVLFYSDRGCRYLSVLKEAKGNKLFDEVLQENYVEGHVPYLLYKHFQFIDGDDEPRLEIICKSVEAYECEI